MEHRPRFDCIALLLQGGGALGAYQAGVYEALAEVDLRPDWVAGTSIGGINSAIIAGNTREGRVAKLREFWELVSRSPFGFDGDLGPCWPGRCRARLRPTNERPPLACSVCPAFTRRDFQVSCFSRRARSRRRASAIRRRSRRRSSAYRFDLINSENYDVRLSLGSVNARSGQLVYLNSTTDIIRAEHVMASGALPPGFPAIEIDGEYYWDGGVVSNTPLAWRAKRPPGMLAFQVDLWAAPGQFRKISGGYDSDEGDLEFEPHHLPHRRVQGD